MEEKRENMGFAFWQNVDRFRKERTIAEIARSEGLKYQRLKEQRSDNTLPRADYAYLIAKDIGVSVESLFTGVYHSDEPRIDAIARYLSQNPEKLDAVEVLLFDKKVGQSFNVVKG